MPSKPAIVLLANARWDALWEWSHILSTLFAGAGYPTVCVETTGIRNPRVDAVTIRKILKRLSNGRSGARPDSKKGKHPLPNLTVYSPIVAPPTYGAFRSLNSRLFVPRVLRDLRGLAGPEPVVMAFTPTQTSLDLVFGLNPRLLWYHCVLNYEEIPGVPADLRETERRLLAKADVATVDSGFLMEKHRDIRRDMVHIESGVDFELFRGKVSGSPTTPPKTLYYFGAADERRFDFDLVRGVAEAGYTVRMLGTLSKPAFARVPGVEYLGSVPHRDLPEHLRNADALIIPYKITAFSKGTFPAKTYEALATGKPVVATPLPDLARLRDYVYVAEGAEGFVHTLRGLPETETPEKVRQRIEVARNNSWEARFAKFEELLRGSLGAYS